MRRPLFALALTAGLAAPASARAGDPALADALFQEGLRLSGEGDHEAACPKFKASLEADPAVGTRFYLADCLENVGKLASAWSMWNAARDAAAKAGDAKRVEIAKARLAALDPRLPRLKVNVANPVPGLEVYRDEGKLAPAAFGLPAPVDPGRHVVAVVRGAEVLKKAEVDASEGEIETVNLDLAAIEKAAPSPKPAAKEGRADPRQWMTVRESKSSQKTIGWVLVGVGGAGLVTAGVLEIVALSKKSASDDRGVCLNDFCTGEGIRLRSQASDFAEAGQWVGLGALLVGAFGVTLVATAPTLEVTPGLGTRAKLSPWVAPSGGGLVVRGRL